MISFLTRELDHRLEIRTEQLSNCNTMRQMASPMLSVPLVLDDCCTWRSHSCPTMTTRTNPTMKEAETPKPARQEGAPHLDLAAPCLASSFSPARSSCRSSRPLPALPPPSSPRTSPSERTERGAEDERRCSFVLSPFSRGGAGATATEQQGTAREPTTGRRARRRIATPATYGASSAEREGTTMSRRGRAASEGRGRRCNRATGNRQPPFHSFLHLHTCAFSLISSACFLWQVTASMRRREGQARRRKRPRYTKPATHGRLLASFLASICTPIDL